VQRNLGPTEEGLAILEAVVPATQKRVRLEKAPEGGTSRIAWAV
jgi:hypothetical protein